MNLRPHRRSPPDINLTPLIDVVFLLLIFFMVSTTFKDDARLRVSLPKAQGEDVPAQEAKMIRLVIDPAGRYFIDDQALADGKAATLRKALQQLKDREGAMPLLIQADASATHQSVMTAMDAASQAGLSQIAFAATRPENDTP